VNPAPTSSLLGGNPTITFLRDGPGHFWNPPSGQIPFREPRRVKIGDFSVSCSGREGSGTSRHQECAHVCTGAGTGALLPGISIAIDDRLNWPATSRIGLTRSIRGNPTTKRRNKKPLGGEPEKNFIGPTLILIQNKKKKQTPFQMAEYSKFSHRGSGGDDRSGRLLLGCQRALDAQLGAPRPHIA